MLLSCMADYIDQNTHSKIKIILLNHADTFFQIAENTAQQVSSCFA